MTIRNSRKILFVLAFSAGLLSAPLVLANIGDLDILGQTRASPATMGALEVATVAAVVPGPEPSMPSGLALSIVRIP